MTRQVCVASYFMTRQTLCCIKFYASPNSTAWSALVTRKEARLPFCLPFGCFVDKMSGSEGGNAQFSTAITLLRQATDILSGVSSPQNSSL